MFIDGKAPFEGASVGCLYWQTDQRRITPNIYLRHLLLLQSAVIEKIKEFCADTYHDDSTRIRVTMKIKYLICVIYSPAVKY